MDYSCDRCLRRDRRLALRGATLAAILSRAPAHRPAGDWFAEAEEAVLDTADGERVIVWHVPPREKQPVFLYFHGNGGSLRWRDERFRALISDGSGLVAPKRCRYSDIPSRRALLLDRWHLCPPSCLQRSPLMVRLKMLHCLSRRSKAKPQKAPCRNFQIKCCFEPRRISHFTLPEMTWEVPQSISLAWGCG
jgi:hypothetical protein